MKKVIIVLILVFAGLIVSQHFFGKKVVDQAIQINKITPKTLDIGNPRLAVEIVDADANNDSILHDVKVLDKNTNKTILLKKVDAYHMIINYVTQDDKYIIADLGTSLVRETKVYDLDTGLEKISFCNLGFGFVNRNIIYTDCTIDNKFLIRENIVENGEYNPIIYKLNIDTLDKKAVLISDDLHRYFFDQHPKNAYNITITSVEKFSDWADVSKWKQSHMTI
ncbi:MAG: hypothetical protein NTZ44_01045 [Candidatus Nomurabacteria bacterium]|nr:hypothetical protein [Candidatus Nomurabacteria bacterium]